MVQRKMIRHHPAVIVTCHSKRSASAFRISKFQLSFSITRCTHQSSRRGFYSDTCGYCGRPYRHSEPSPFDQWAAQHNEAGIDNSSDRTGMGQLGFPVPCHSLEPWPGRQTRSQHRSLPQQRSRSSGTSTAAQTSLSLTSAPFSDQRCQRGLVTLQHDLSSESFPGHQHRWTQLQLRVTACPRRCR